MPFISFLALFIFLEKKFMRRNIQFDIESKLIVTDMLSRIFLIKFFCQILKSFSIFVFAFFRLSGFLHFDSYQITSLHWPTSTMKDYVADDFDNFSTLVRYSFYFALFPVVLDINIIVFRAMFPVVLDINIIVFQTVFMQ